MNQQLLYIEDNHLNIRLIKRCLSHLPVDLNYVETGEEGIEIIKACCPDLVLLDVNLPTMSGIDVLITLKSNCTTQHIPIIALTADTTIKTRKLCEMYGASAYLQKPISRHKLVQTIQPFLNTVYPAIQPATHQRGTNPTSIVNG